MTRVLLLVDLDDVQPGDIWRGEHTRWFRLDDSDPYAETCLEQLRQSRRYSHHPDSPHHMVTVARESNA